MNRDTFTPSLPVTVREEERDREMRAWCSFCGSPIDYGYRCGACFDEIETKGNNKKGDKPTK